MAERIAELRGAPAGESVGAELRCPRYDCDWTEPHGSAEVVNEYGVKDPVPARCKRCGLRVEVVSVVRLSAGEGERSGA
jgi:hypothetical protein